MINTYIYIAQISLKNVKAHAKVYLLLFSSPYWDRIFKESALRPLLSSSRNVSLCICLRLCPFPMQFFLGLSLALRSHGQMPASHWSGFGGRGWFFSFIFLILCLPYAGFSFMSVCLCVCVSPPHAILFEASDWPSDNMISSRPMIGQPSLTIKLSTHPPPCPLGGGGLI